MRRITYYIPHPPSSIALFRKRTDFCNIFCFILFCFVLFCFVLSCFVFFCFVLLCFIVFYFFLPCFVLFCPVLSCFPLFFRSFVRSLWLSGMACMIPARPPTQPTPSSVTLSPLYIYYIFLFVCLFVRSFPLLIVCHPHTPHPPLDPKTLSLKNATHKTQGDWLSWL